jgi:hypothetical protein
LFDIEIGALMVIGKEKEGVTTLLCLLGQTFGFDNIVSFLLK